MTTDEIRTVAADVAASELRSLKARLEWSSVVKGRMWAVEGYHIFRLGGTHDRHYDISRAGVDETVATCRTLGEAFGWVDGNPIYTLPVSVERSDPDEPPRADSAANAEPGGHRIPIAPRRATATALADINRERLTHAARADRLADLLKREGDYESSFQFRRETYWLPIARRVVAEGWRPPARVIRTLEELAAAPEETVVRSRFGQIVARFPGGLALGIGYPRPVPWLEVALPATVLSAPESDPTDREDRKPMSWTRLVENNEGEGETWTFWIRTEGNESELARLAQIVADFDDGDEQFQVLEPVDLTEDQLDALVTFGGVGYMRLHTKLSGRLQLPTEAPKTGAYPLGAWFPYLYKGGITKCVEADR